MNPRLAPLVVICGLCTLVPLPILDDWCERRVTRTLLSGIAKDRGVELEAAALHTLTEDRSSMLLGCLFSMFIWPFKKLFSTFFVVFIIKQGIDKATLAAHRAAMVRVALDQGLLTASTLQAGEAERVRDAMDAAIAGVRTSPLGRGLRRLANPEIPVPDGADGLVRLVEGLRRYGGGAPVVEAFAARLAVRPGELAGGGKSG